MVEAPSATTADLLPRTVLDRPGPKVAPDLLGCVLEHETADGLVAVVLTEVEAYDGQTDPASHAYRGRTARNAVMFGPAGYAYVYFTYGMHFCVNVVCMPAGTASAVLLRAGKVIAGEDLARRRRSVRSERDLARGPARLCQALGIDRRLDGADLCVPGSPLRLRAPLPAQVGVPPAGERGGGADAANRSGQKALIATGPRVGVREGADVPWRFWLDGEPTVSVYRPWVPRRR
ncbi:MAG TPA: DNA-3-methyladenine glycosylase [Trebonia sp.]|jgi:DNA-3-methyladenine glycosylase|nr:DNA-3-methyladenine glycosylase [Trebonia sp.]